MRYLIMCRSLTYAQRAQRTLERAGVTASIQRAPQELTTEGCGYCVRVRAVSFQDALRLLREKNVSYGRLFRIESAGIYTEVAG